jgi:hypothetical protein
MRIPESHRFLAKVPAPRRRVPAFQKMRVASGNSYPDGQGLFELMRMQAQAAEQHRKPQPAQTVWSIGSMEWLAEQEKSG